MKKIYLFVFIIAVSHYLQAQNSIMFEQANQLYQNKMYDSASSLYMQMIDEGYHSATLYYNAGNAFYKQNKIGNAIWCYKKSIEKNTNKSVTDNLQLAYNKITNRVPFVKDIFFIRWWKNLQNYYSKQSWSVFALVTFLLAFIIQLYRIIKHKNTITRLLRNALFFISFISLTMIAFIQFNIKNNYKAIIIKDTPFYNVDNWIKVERYITDGNEVQVLNATETYKRSGLIKIKLSNGKVGFVNKADILKE
jgi:multisubunit Na+/H+ antiporter MnhF subunit